ncbi:type II secretion system F family protein [Aeromicrobium fastidiosum]|uniref:Type II secretion system protein F n=1 Tax=Aeromicrobium fastidiosum TaxID=52699 RepID=A0A641AQ62_9ACTN|nr:type II secretion system F family protein [Aeromicrobium fastidiosum]KAA1379667.1 type II secretion system protein F [Aeromicrobium fastidiosum]MBP2389142.1 tight adherence protein B [Aeromicrobium fastidiosum]
MLLLGVLLVTMSLGGVYVAVNGVPVGRVDSARISRLVVQERRSLLTRVTDAVINGVEAVMRRQGWRPFGARELELANVAMPVANLVVMLLCISVVAFSVGLVLAHALLGLLLAVLVPVLAKVWLSRRGARQRRAFAKQLPQGLQMMAASLRAGHSLPRVLDAISKELDAPMGEELARVVNENRLGRDLVESLEAVAERMQSTDFRWVAGAISAQRETGGNLNEILDQVAETIRERLHVRMQVMSLSAEGRLSAVILMGLPVCIGIYYMLVSADTMSLFVATGIGKLLLLGSAVLYLLGGLWMRSIVNIEF